MTGHFKEKLMKKFQGIYTLRISVRGLDFILSGRLYYSPPEATTRHHPGYPAELEFDPESFTLD